MIKMSVAPRSNWPYPNPQNKMEEAIQDFFNFLVVLSNPRSPIIWFLGGFG